MYILCIYMEYTLDMFVIYYVYTWYIHSIYFVYKLYVQDIYIVYEKYIPCMYAVPWGTPGTENSQEVPCLKGKAHEPIFLNLRHSELRIRANDKGNQSDC